MFLRSAHTHTHVYLTKQATRKGEAPIMLATRVSKDSGSDKGSKIGDFTHLMLLQRVTRADL